MNFKKQGYFVHVANPLLIKKYFDAEIRKGKTDRKDALKLSRYGTEKWWLLKNTQKLIKFIWIYNFYHENTTHFWQLSQTKSTVI